MFSVYIHENKHKPFSFFLYTVDTRLVQNQAIFTFSFHFLYIYLVVVVFLWVFFFGFVFNLLFFLQMSLYIIEVFPKNIYICEIPLK